ncbi:homeobox protein 4 [Vespa velutina]|uniref:homeobox protein 4 n=1 Tax=Vespa velutina TaxID=202808 RepID=UPI001FB2E94B|nr:homeobox protein 4 [Vespa velutina]
MSLIAYGSSDDNSEDEEVNSGECSNDKNKITILTKSLKKDLCVPSPKNNTDVKIIVNNESLSKFNWSVLPKPINVNTEKMDLKEEGDIPMKKELEQEKRPTKKPVKIMIRSLCEFKDLDEEDKKKQNRIAPIEKGSGLFSILPPPKILEQKSIKPLIPNVVVKSQNVSTTKNIILPSDKLKESNYESNSEDEDESDTNKNNYHGSGMDFFALNTVKSITDTDSTTLDLKNTESNDFVSTSTFLNESKAKDNTNGNNIVHDNNTEQYIQNSNLTLISNVINLPKEEILIKNKAEIGPKLPIPEQEYNVDAEGNVAFDEKAIEYLCGKRGIKRKCKEMEEANIIEISGDDIKPDEREWLVKALTEEPVQRPVSMQSSGINFQSKKKHQITYLAHQAKAMELELKNQWSLNRMTRKQTQSKYGF